MNGARVKETKEKILALIENEFDSDASFEREMGLPPKTVNNWRRDRSASFMKMLPSLADVFDVSAGELLDLPIAHGEEDLSDDELELLTLYRKARTLTQKQRLALNKTLRSVIEPYLTSAHDKRKK